MQVSDFQCIRPFGLRGKWPPDHQYVSSSPSKIPYSGFSPVRLQTGIQPRPSSKLPSLSARPAFPLTGRIYTRLKSLSQKEAFFRPRTCVQSGLSPSERNYPVQRSLAPQRVVLSRQIIAYYYLMRASRPLLPVYELSSRSLRDGLVWAGNEKVPNLSRSSVPIVPSSVPRRLGDCSWLLLHRPLWPPPPSQKIGVRTLTLAGTTTHESCYHEAAKFTLCYGPMRLLAPLRLGRLLSSFHLLGHPWGVSSITTRANNQFPWPDFHRLDKQPYRLQTKDTKVSDISDSKCRGLRGEFASSKGQPPGGVPTDLKGEFFASFGLLAIKSSLLRALRVLRGENFFTVKPEEAKS